MKAHTVLLLTALLLLVAGGQLVAGQQFPKEAKEGWRQIEAAMARSRVVYEGKTFEPPSSKNPRVTPCEAVKDGGNFKFLYSTHKDGVLYSTVYLASEAGKFHLDKSDRGDWKLMKVLPPEFSIPSGNPAINLAACSILHRKLLSEIDGSKDFRIVNWTDADSQHPNCQCTIEAVANENVLFQSATVEMDPKSSFRVVALRLTKAKAGQTYEGDVKYIYDGGATSLFPSKIVEEWKWPNGGYKTIYETSKVEFDGISPDEFTLAHYGITGFVAPQVGWVSSRTTWIAIGIGGVLLIGFVWLRLQSRS